MVVHRTPTLLLTGPGEKPRRRGERALAGPSLVLLDERHEALSKLRVSERHSMRRLRELTRRRADTDAWIREWGILQTCPVRGPASIADDFGVVVRIPDVPVHIHQGNDMMAATGTPIVAPFAGTAVAAPNVMGGLAVKVYGELGYVYNAHLSAYGRLGQVRAGTVIGYVGSTGDAGGPTTTSSGIRTTAPPSIRTRSSRQLRLTADSSRPEGTGATLRAVIRTETSRAVPATARRWSWMFGARADLTIALCWIPIFAVAHVLSVTGTNDVLLNRMFRAAFVLSLLHQPLTLALVYGDREQFALRKRLFTWSPPIAVGLIAVAVLADLWIVVPIAAIWNTIHTLQQRYGLSRIYSRKAGYGSARLDGRCCTWAW
jgi:hypothetical protein